MMLIVMLRVGHLSEEHDDDDDVFYQRGKSLRYAIVLSTLFCFDLLLRYATPCSAMLSMPFCLDLLLRNHASIHHDATPRYSTQRCSDALLLYYYPAIFADVLCCRPLMMCYA